MRRHRITLILGPAAGGLLAAAFLPMAVAVADDTYVDVADPSEPAQITGVTGMPPFDQDVLSRNLFDVIDQTQSTASAPRVAGEYFSDVSTFTTASGFSNEEVLVTEHAMVPVLFSGPPGAVFAGFDTTHDPGIGSVLDTMNFGGGWGNEYADIVAAGIAGAAATHDVSDELLTPLGDIPLLSITFEAGLDPASYLF